MGWSPVGEECRRYQLNIGSRTFSSTVAVVCALGFVSWQIVEVTVAYCPFYQVA